VDHEEDYLLVHAWRLAQGEPHVQPLDGDGPYIVGTYMPLFPLVASFFTSPELPSLKPGRVIAFGSAVCISLLLIAMLIVLRVPAPVALVLGLLFLFQRDASKWLPLYRVDTLGIMLALSGLFAAQFCLREGDTDKEKWWPDQRKERLFYITSIILCLAAGFTKQTLVAAPGAILLWFALHGQWRWALTWMGVGGIIGVIIFVAIEIWTPGSFWFHTVTANANTMSGWQLGIWWRHFFLFQRWVIVGGTIVAALFLYAFFQRSRNEDSSGGSKISGYLLYFIYSLFAIVTFLGSAKLGAAENYTLEPTIGFLILMGLVIQTEYQSTKPIKNILVSLIFLILLSIQYFYSGGHILPPFIQQNARISWGVSNPNLQDYEAAVYIEQVVENAPESIWCERATISLRQGAPLFLHPFICAQLAREGKWDPGTALKQLRSGRFTFLILTEDISDLENIPADAQYHLPLREAIVENYQQQEKVKGWHFSYYIWKYIE
jgi:hypothetical protein